MEQTSERSDEDKPQLNFYTLTITSLIKDPLPPLCL